MKEGWNAPRTELSSVSDGFVRPDSGISVAGMLSPVDGKSTIPATRVEQSQLLIGRGQGTDGVDLQVADDNVSRKHARISRVGNHFMLEDLGSRNGTFVDGVPIRSVRLEDGDTIQIGRNLLCFDHLFEFQHGPRSVPESMTVKDWHQRRRPEGSPDRMWVRFWGTRGSLPTPGPDTRKFGGNTTCVELRFGDSLIVLDSGSGIREMSNAWAEEFGDRPIEANLCLTHLHWDHIQGFPFFAPAYAERNRICVYGAHRGAGSTRDLLSAQMQGDYFPVPLEAMKADLEFRDTAEEFEIDRCAVRTFDLPHPSGSLGYRFEFEGRAFVMATDCELDQVALNRDELKQDHRTPRQYDNGFLAPLRNADLLLVDCQYTDSEYQDRIGWGHNSIATVVDLCMQAEPKMVALTHHDPTADDSSVSARVKEVADRLHHSGFCDILVFAAREQAVVDVCIPPRPPKIGTTSSVK